MEPTISDTGMAPEFTAAVEIPYDLRFMDFVLNWTTGLAGLAGSVRKESDALHLALDETLTFLINAYPDAETWEGIRIELQLQTDAVIEIAVTNAGPPVHLNRIPQYNPQAPSEADMDGLWYFLAREAVDDLTFQNRGMDGWRAVIRKRLAGASFEKKTPVRASDAMPARKIPFVTRLATPEDAADLVDLTYDTYHYSYPVEEFYNESKLRQALKKGAIISLVVEADGVIVGNSSFILSRKTPRCAYSCSLMVKRAFRQSRAIIHLIKEGEQYIGSGQLDVDLYYGTVVTTHTGSQKAGVRAGFLPLALLLAVGAAVDYRGMKISRGERESFLICIRLSATPQLSVLYLSERHHAVMARLLAQAGFDCRLSGEEATPEATRSTFTVDADAGEGSAYLTVTQLGRDFALRLQKKIFTLKADGIQTVIILIPAWRPLPPGLDHELGRINAVFTGLKPVSARECYLVYSALSGALDFERICLLDPLAQKLKEHSRQLYEEMVAEEPEQEDL